MKKILFPIILLGVISLSSICNAQTYKFGHINSQEVLVLMPEYKQAIDSLTNTRSRYSLQEEKLQVEINRKYNELIEQQNELDSLILETRYSEFQAMQTRLQEFQTNASQRLRALEGTLIESIMGKLRLAISTVATELDMIYVFDMGTGNPIHASDKSIDLAPMVKDKLGLN